MPGKGYRFTMHDIAELLGGPPIRRIMSIANDLNIKRRRAVQSLGYNAWGTEPLVVRQGEAIRIMAEWYRRRGERALRKMEREQQSEEPKKRGRPRQGK
jgi:hypothetical protein